MEQRIPGRNAGEAVARRNPTALRRQTALGVFAVYEPVQELGVLGAAPVVRLASVSYTHLDVYKRQGTFIVQRIGPSGQCLVDVVLCSRPVEVETEFSEVLDFVGREP